ncbi:MAG: hypothetical protein HQK83_18370 [Fibrobacteria bacterium]|nr:hypothetical protein [Fibrobacteria bacterium]
MKAMFVSFIAILFFLSGCEKIKQKETFYSDKKPKEKYTVTKQNGKEIKNGLYEAWFKNGKTKHVFNYLDDVKHGAQKTFYKSGTLQLKEQHLFGKLMGKQQKWDEQGNLISETIFEDGKKSGEELIYFPSGKVNKKINYSSNQKNGIEIIYDEAQSLISAAWYKEGQKIEAPADSAIVVEKIVKEDTTTVKPKQPKADEEEKGV